MNKLYPRLLPGAASRAFAELQRQGPRPPRDLEDPALAQAVFAATGGTRVTGPELAAVRLDLLQLARAHGFPEDASRSGHTAFDIAVSRHLHANLDMTPGEASQRSVWAYFGLILVPDVCAWRYPPNETRGYLNDRFLGTDLTRHTLAKLWIRAHLLQDPGARDPYHLIDVLGEADVDQILARRLDVAATPRLAREVVRAHRDDPANGSGPPAREVLRDSLKRLLRLASFISFDSMSDGQLLALAMDSRDLSRRALAGRE